MSSTPSVAERSQSVLLLPAVLILLLGGLTRLSPISGNSTLVWSFWGAAGVLAAWLLILATRASRSGQKLEAGFAPKRAHWVQAVVQIGVYAYWGWYWPEVYAHGLHIFAQIVFAYAFDMLLSWTRRGQWILGFGQWPIILSTNLFLWFRDDWFYLQFVMVAAGYLGKELIRWQRDGRRAHIFNPSALSLSTFSVILLVTGGTGITWGREIADTLLAPEHIYLEIFLLGLVVQALFYVTLTTASAAAVLFGLSFIFKAVTGLYFFGDSTIPIAVFLGLHLLVTDPATSPRTNLGRVIFGGVYGLSVFGLYGLLDWLGQPTFYDKLLFVPVLNLAVRSLDRFADGTALERLDLGKLGRGLPPWQLNLAHMTVWMAVFGAAYATGHVRADHEAREPSYWEAACEDGSQKGCETLVMLHSSYCAQGVAPSCNELAVLLSQGRVTPFNPGRAAAAFNRACELGFEAGCSNLERLREWRYETALQNEAACADGDATSCVNFAQMVYNGDGVPPDQERAIAALRKACELRHQGACQLVEQGLQAGR